MPRDGAPIVFDPANPEGVPLHFAVVRFVNKDRRESHGVTISAKVSG